MKVFVIILVILISVLALLPYDTDDTYDSIMKKYGYDIGERTYTSSCATDGVGVQWVPFGTIANHCDTWWFVLFNIFPFQIHNIQEEAIKIKQ